MNTNISQFPNSAIYDTKTVKVTRPEAQVAYSKEKAILHHDGSHAEVPGPSRIAGKGKASEVIKILGAVKGANTND